MPAAAADTRAARELWRPDQSRFIRRWQVLGPVAPGAIAAKAEAALRPGTQPVSAAGQDVNWRPLTAWGDIVDLTGPLATPAYRGRAAAPEFAYAFTTITREAAGKALLSIGSDDALRVWVNGKDVHRGESRGFRFDAERIALPLRAGDNTLLLRFAHRSGPWRFAARVIETDATIEPSQEFAPRLAAAGGRLVASTDVSRHAGAAVTATLLAAGGRVSAERSAARGQDASFDLASLPDGAHEVRFVTQTARGEPRVAHLPWYQGDAFAAARALVQAADAAPGGPTGDRLRLLAAVAKDRVDLENPVDDAWPLLHAVLMEYEELQLAGAGQGGPERAYGFVRLAYTDDTDGSTQFCRAYLPAQYDGSTPAPLVLYLHGYNPQNPPLHRWWRVDSRHDDAADRYGVIWIELHGRGNTQYRGMGERDVLRCLAAARERLRIDDTRVYVTGESMGGSGTWAMASRHPELFAAAAPVFGGWDARVLKGGTPDYNNPRADRVPERYLQEAQSSFANAENLWNVPLFVLHGDADAQVSVEHSRHATRMLQRWGYDLRYEEYPGWAHEDLRARDRIVPWLLQHSRKAAPRRVRVRSMDLDGAAAHWLSVQAWEAPLHEIRADAEIVGPGQVRLDTKNVAAVRLVLPPAWHGSGKTVRVSWNGRESSWASNADGEVLVASPAKKTPLAKRPGLAGGVSDFLATPFLVVVGTISPDAGMQRVCREKAEAFAARWEQWQYTRPRMRLDTEVSDDDLQRYSLLLIGDADANAVTRRIAAGLPLRIDAGRVTIDGRRFQAADAVLQMIHPNPLQPQRYAVIVAGTSRAGLERWSPDGLWNMPYGQPTQFFDWTLQDGREVTLENGLGPERGWVAAGVFDRYWRRDDRWVFPGDARLREHAATP